jgi:hypothetical protein
VLKNDTVSKDASSYMAIFHGHAVRRAQPSKTFNPGPSTQNFQEPKHVARLVQYLALTVINAAASAST